MGTTGILAIYKGKEEGKTVLFRCELDALPIEN
jgi:metal-dependent amidase/aminoacylase/carboxypeptidase family protein